MKKYLLSAVIVIPLLLLLAALWYGLHHNQQSPQPSIAAKAAANTVTQVGSFAHQGLDKNLSVQDYTDANLPTGLYLLNIWGSWCRSCVEEHGYLADYRQSLPIVGLNWYDSAAKAQTFLQKYGNPYDMVLLDTEGTTIVDLGVRGAPETLLVKGKQILAWHIGILTPSVFAEKFAPIIDASAP